MTSDEPVNLRVLLEHYETLYQGLPQWYTATDILIRIMAAHILKETEND